MQKKPTVPTHSPTGLIRPCFGKFWKVHSPKNAFCPYIWTIISIFSKKGGYIGILWDCGKAVWDCGKAVWDCGKAVWDCVGLWFFGKNVGTVDSCINFCKRRSYKSGKYYAKKPKPHIWESVKAK